MSDTGSRPLWQQVLDDLEERLASGDITDRFPTDRELVERYGVSRHTVREAVRRLRARGMVERHRGRGSFVRPDRLQQPVGTLYSLFQEVERDGKQQRSDVLAFDRRTDPDIARELGLPRSAELIHLSRVRYADDEPLALDDVWLPAELAAPILEADMTHTALYDELAERCGIRVDATEELIEPVIPDDDCRALLGTEAGEALFRIERRGFLEGRLIEWRITLIRGGRFSFVSSWRRDGDSEPLRFEAR